MSGQLLDGLLGAGATYRGDLVFEGRVRIDGELLGSVQSQDLLEIGPSGRVEGHVEVAQCLVAGALDGTLVASERVTLLASARVRGTIDTPWLDVRNGATWIGEAVVSRPGAEP